MEKKDPFHMRTALWELQMGDWKKVTISKGRQRGILQGETCCVVKVEVYEFVISQLVEP